MEEEILEKIFIAISENLVAGLLSHENVKQISSFKFTLNENETRRILQQNEHQYDVQHVQTYVSKRFNLQINGAKKPREMDDQHKIDVVLQQNNHLHAIEVKAGNSGQAKSPNDFLRVNLKRKVSRDYHSKSGSVASILAHNQRHICWRYSIVLREPIQNNKTLENSWFLCLRNRTTWQGRGFHARHNGRTFFDDCTIFFIDDLVNAAGPETFATVMRKIAPFCNCSEFAENMWLKAGGEKDQWVRWMGQLPRP